MRITGVSLENFRCHESFKASFSGQTVLYGSNGSGKTSILEAIRYALFGRCNGTDGKGSGASRLIKEGAKSALIEVTVENRGRILVVQSVINQSGPNDFCVTDLKSGEVVSDSRKTLWPMLGLSAEYVEMLCNASQYLASGDVAKVFADLFGGNVSAKDVLEKSEAPDVVVDLLEDGGMSAGSSYPADIWQGIGQTAYTLRTGVNKQIKELESELEGIGFVPPQRDKNGNELGADAIPKLREMVEKLAARRDELILEAGAAQYGRTEKAIAADLEREAGALAAVASRGKGLLEEVDALARERLGADLELRSAVNDESQARGRLTIAEMEMKKFASGKCPTCGAAVDSDAMLAANDNLDDLRKQHTDTVADVNSKRAALELIDAKLATAKDEYRDVGKAENELREKVAALKAERPCSRTYEEIIEERNAVDAKTERAQAALTALSRQARRDEIELQIAQKQNRATSLSVVVRELKNRELLNQLGSSDKLDRFTKSVNDALCGRYRIEVLQGKAGLVPYLVEGNSMREYKLCSKGEQWLIGYAVATAIAGTNPVMLDDADHLDIENMKVVAECLAKRTGDTICATATLDDSITIQTVREITKCQS